MDAARKTFLPRLLVLLGFGSAVIGSVALCLATFQIQGPSTSGLSGSGSITLTFTSLPWPPATAALLVLFMAIPVWAWPLLTKFYLTTLVAPAVVAMGMVTWIYQAMLASPAGSLVVSSAVWVFVGIALVFLGCALEILGVILTRRARADAVGTRSPETAHASSVVSPPR